jgi:phosphoglycolate phosphatase
MSLNLPACVLFDLDGTLVDSLPGIEFSVREAFKSCKFPVPNENLREMIGPPIRTILSRAGNVVEESTLNALERAFRASYDGEGWQRAVCFPEAQRVLRLMHDSGHRLFVLSNKPRHVSLQILERERILQYFEAVVTRDSQTPNYGGKDEMIRALLAERSIRPEHCLMVGDTSEDAGAAVGLGIKFIWMTHGYGSTAQMSSLSVAHSLDSFSQFLPLVTKEPVCD